MEQPSMDSTHPSPQFPRAAAHFQSLPETHINASEYIKRNCDFPPFRQGFLHFLYIMILCGSKVNDMYRGRGWLRVLQLIMRMWKEVGMGCLGCHDPATLVVLF